MSEESKSPVEQDVNAGGKNEVKDTVAYESFQKVLGEKKNAQAKLSQYEQELQTLREEKLQREGKNEELISTYKQKYEQVSKKYEETQKQYAWSTLTGEIKREALKHGCTDPDKLIRLMEDEDLRSIEVGDNFNIDKESLSSVIERSKKDNHFLFKSTTPVAANGRPVASVKKTEKRISDMSREELEELYKQTYK